MSNNIHTLQTDCGASCPRPTSCSTGACSRGTSNAQDSSSSCSRARPSSCSTGACSRGTPIDQSQTEQRQGSRISNGFSNLFGGRILGRGTVEPPPAPCSRDGNKYCGRSILPPQKKTCTWVPPSQRGESSCSKVSGCGQRSGGSLSTNSASGGGRACSGGSCSRSVSTGSTTGACCKRPVSCISSSGRPCKPVVSPLVASNVTRRCYGAACNAATAVRSVFTRGSSYEEMTDKTKLIDDRRPSCHDQRHQEIKVGTCVNVKVPAGDGCQRKRFLAVVLRILPNGLFNVGTRQGEILAPLTKEQLEVAPSQALTRADVPRRVISVMEAGRAAEAY